MPIRIGSFYTGIMKNHRVFLILCVLLTVGSFVLFASDYDRGIGAQIGRLSGGGLSFYQELNAVSALQATVGLSLSSYPGYTSYFDYGLGVEYQKTFFSSSYQDWFETDLYWFVGLNHGGSASWDGSGIQSPFTPSVGFGAGFGVEPVFLSHLSVPVSFGYGVFYTAEGSTFVDMLDIAFLAQIGVRYRY